MANMDKLKGRIVENRFTYDDCAKALGISAASFKNKINNKTKLGFGIEEAEKLSNLLNLGNEDKLNIFLGKTLL